MSKVFDFSNLRGDIYGGLTAGIVALPLALAFGEASGAGPIAGIWGAIFVGFFASLFGGTGSQISGPTGPMVVVFAGVFADLSTTGGNNLSLIFAAVVLAGLMQILFGFMKLGQYIRLVPYPVISGFMSGIGVIIIALQLSRLFGHEPDGGGTIPALTAIPGAVMDPNMAALIVGLVTLATIFLWPAKLGKIVPGALAALIIGTTLSLFITGSPILGDIPTGFPEFVMPALPDNTDTMLIVVEAAFILALLGAIDSLLTSLVADNMTRTRHNSDQELIGQGIGNTVAGLFGAIPGAGATMRTVVNIRTGGSTKLSGMLHGLVLLAVVLVFAPYAAQIPHAVLAGILIKVGWDIIDVNYIKRAHKGPRWDLLLMALVLGLTVFVDLITAVVAGVAVACAAFVKQLADEQLQAFRSGTPTVTTEEEKALLESAGGKVMLFDFGGPLSFGAAADLGLQVRAGLGAATSAMVLDFSRVPFLDISAARAIETVICDAKQADQVVFVTGMSDDVRQVLSSFDADHCLPENTSYSERTDAIRAAVTLVKGGQPANDGDVDVEKNGALAS
ncbi:MAG: SulP family inorganic anion transporter [Pseudomonadota bacterium]